MHGVSLSPLVRSGQELKGVVKKDNSECDLTPKRGDIVSFCLTPSCSLPYIKQVVGVPGDAFSLERGEKGGWGILINGKSVKNSAGIAYRLDEAAHRMLSLYVKDYKGVIPDKAFLALGDSPGGTQDSSRFGLIGLSSITGLVPRKNVPEHGKK